MCLSEVLDCKLHKVTLANLSNLLLSLSHVHLFTTPWTAARQASLSFTISWSLVKRMSNESVMPSNHLVLCRPLLLLPSVFPSIRVFANVSSLHQMANLSNRRIYWNYLGQLT